MTEREQRLAVVAEAETWLRTQFHHDARLKGIGVDCAQLLIAVYHACGLTPNIDVGYYPPDWHHHRSEERYLWWLDQYAKEVSEPTGPGDVVAFKFARCYSHAAIITEWPTVIHAYLKVGCIIGSAEQEPLLDRPRKFYTLWSGVK